MLLFGMVVCDGKEQYLAFENIDSLVEVQDADLKPSKVTKCGGGVQRSLGRLRELSTGTLNVHGIFQPPYYDFDVVCVLPNS